MTLRTAVVGVAGMGGTHTSMLARNPGHGLELVAMCDVDEAAVGKLVERHALDVATFTSTEELFGSDVCDAVVIATPNRLHLAQVSAALDAGLHVYCEKPLALTAAEAEGIARLARDRRRVVQVGFQHRFEHTFSTPHEMVAAGKIGEVYRANLTSTNWFRPQAYFEARPWRKRWEAAGGGVLLLQAIHQLDAFIWTAGMPSRITAHAWRARHRIEVEDDVTALLEFGNGARGMLAASTVDAVGTDRMELHGERGSLVCDRRLLRWGKTPDAVQVISDERRDAFASVPVEWEEVLPSGAATSFQECVAACHRDFAEAVEEGRDPLNTPEESVRTLEVVNAVYLSAVSGEPVTLPIDRDLYADVFAKLCAGKLELPVRPGAA